MEIPYTVKARPDTGLWNSKIGIWLFLASEVMLFGGLFSSYVFLRLGADFPWPVHILNVKLGAFNTVVLILSSVFVVLAWVELRLGHYKAFQKWMFAVVACALIFLGVKSVEYKEKFTHYGAKLTDAVTIVEGHGHGHQVTFVPKTITFDLEKSTLKAFLADDHHGEHSAQLEIELDSGQKVALTQEWLDEQKSAYALRVAELGERESAPDSTLRVKWASHGPAVLNGKKLQENTEDVLITKDGVRLEGVRTENIIAMEAHGLEFYGVESEEEIMEKTAAFSYLKKGSYEFELDKHDDGSLKRHGELYTGHFAEPVEMKIPKEEVAFYSNHGPRYNTYYAIYFTLTGLHALHVFGGAVVLAYFGFASRRLFEKDPKHLANRVEAGGLFWHFVDLVWIFLFPVLYLL